MKKFLAVGMFAALVSMIGQAEAKVQITSWNPAFFGGDVRIKGPTDSQRCSAHFPKKGVGHVTSSGWRYFESTVALPCELADGGYVVFEVNRRPVGFRVPASFIMGGQDIHAAVEGGVTPFLVFYWKDRRFADVQPGVKFYSMHLYPIAQGGECDIDMHVEWPNGIGYEGWLDLVKAARHSILYKFVGDHPCAAWTREKK
jgi:hypothetical protein